MEAFSEAGVERVGLTTRILLADDNPVVREATGKLLRILGCEVDVVQNGAEAVTAAQGRAYEIILLDIQMPVMGGLEAAEIIRRNAVARDDFPRIVAMSADTNALDLELCGGIDSVITKPIRATELKQLLDFPKS